MDCELSPARSPGPMSGCAAVSGGSLMREVHGEGLRMGAVYDSIVCGAGWLPAPSWFGQ